MSIKQTIQTINRWDYQGFGWAEVFGFGAIFAIGGIGIGFALALML